MNITLDPDVEKLVRDKVESGRYTDAAEVVSAALRLLEERERESTRATFEDLVQAGFDDVENGRVRTVTPELRRQVARNSRALMDQGSPIPWYITGEDEH